MRHNSKRKQPLHDLYYAVRREFLTKYPRCWVYPDLPSEDWHHIERRSEKNLCDIDNAMALSRKAHEKIELNKEWARTKGYLPPKPCVPVTPDYSSDGRNERHIDDIRKELHGQSSALVATRI